MDLIKNPEDDIEAFYFTKLSGDYQPSLRIYKNNYLTLLNTFLKEYEENTELRFIENQLFFCNQEIKIQNSCIYSLKQLDHETFYYVRNRVSERHIVYLEVLDFDEDETNSHIIQAPNENFINDNEGLKAPTIVGISNEYDDEDILDMHATAENFIKFISNRITSLCLINEFLEQRKQELEKELNTVSQPVFSSETIPPVMQTAENTLFKASFEFKNNFDNVHKNDVYEYFEKELLDKKYLTKEKLEEYLVFAFQNKKAPEVKFTFDKIKTQRAIIRVFYNYYLTKAQKPYGEKTAYVELLTNYFNGFDTIKIESNFSK
jgi:hypothetical protein